MIKHDEKFFADFEIAVELFNDYAFANENYYFDFTRDRLFELVNGERTKFAESKGLIRAYSPDEIIKAILEMGSELDMLNSKGNYKNKIINAYIKLVDHLMKKDFFSELKIKNNRKKFESKFDSWFETLEVLEDEVETKPKPKVKNLSK